MLKDEIREFLFARDADLFGVASVEALTGAPAGFAPRDVLPSCKSVIVFACRFAAGTLAATTTVPYTIVRNQLSAKLDLMSVELCGFLEKKGVLAIPTGTIEPTEYDSATGRWRNIISVKHCAQAAGLGVIGKNTLLITPQLGNMVWLCAVLTEAELEPDKPLDIDYCGDCHICENVCPVHATGEPELKQMQCSEHCFNTPENSDWRIVCFRCREACPHCYGTENLAMKRDFTKLH